MKDLLLLPLLLLVGCADSYNLAGKTSPSDSSDTTGTDDTANQDDDTAAPLDPAWYVVRADLTVAAGLGTAAAASVQIDVVDADLERTDCVVDLDPAGIVTTDADGALADTVWWDIPVVPLAASCAPLPANLVVGVGPMHPDVRARLGTVGHDGIADSLYAAYLLLDGEATAFGFAGTAADLLGDDTATLPPPDGLYRLAPLYLVPLPE